MQKIKAPISLRRPFSQRDRDLARVGCSQLTRFQNLLLRSIHFFRRYTFAPHGFNRRNQQVPQLVERTIRRCLGIYRH